MLMATTNALGTETKRYLERLLAALNAMPATWADKNMTAATMIADDVSTPTLDDDFVLMPLDVWSTAQDTWDNAMRELNITPAKPFALETTVLDGKNRIVEVLKLAAGTTVTSTPLPPTAPDPTLPVDPIVAPDDFKLIDPYGPEPDKTPTTTTPPTTTPPTTTPSPTAKIPPLGSPSWPYWALGGAGLAILVGVLVKRGTGAGITSTAGLRGRKIVGTFCEEALAPRRDFESSSFRWKRTGSAWLLVGCPKGDWNKTEQWCRVPTRGYRLLSPTSTRKRCPTGSRRITK